MAAAGIALGVTFVIVVQAVGLFVLYRWVRRRLRRARGRWPRAVRGAYVGGTLLVTGGFLVTAWTLPAGAVSGGNPLASIRFGLPHVAATLGVAGYGLVLASFVGAVIVPRR